MNLQDYFPNVEESAKWIKKHVMIEPRVAVVLSGGLEAFVEGLKDKVEFPFKDIPHFPVARAEGHAGKLVFGTFAGVPLVVLAGRCHYYEGHSPQSVVFPYFVLAKLGAKIILTTNAVGGVNRFFKPGDIMVVADHINMMGINPLIGLAIQRERDQFTSLIEAYDPELRELAKRIASKQGVDLKSGVHIAASGPSYETKAEIRAFRQMGADSVGMGTVPETITANFLGLRVLSFVCVANPAADLHVGEMTHAEVLAAMKAMAPKMVALLKGIVEEI